METHLGQPCEICGGDGYAELIATCIKCNVTSEHVYCMLKVRKEGPHDWVCESCSPPESARKEEAFGSPHVLHGDGEQLSAPSKVHNTSSLQAHSKRPKHAATSKVKFIPTEEVIRLSSGGTTRTTLSPKRGFSNFKASMCRTTPIKPKILTLISPVKKRPRYGSMRILSQIDQHTPQNLKETRETKAPAYAKEYESKKELNAVLPAKEVNSTKANEEKGTNNASSATSKSIRCLSMTSRNIFNAAEQKNADFEEKHLANILPFLHVYRTYFPALRVTWKGSFILGMDTSGESLGAYQAQPPSRVHRKAYKFAQTMPPVLHFKLLPQFELLRNNCLDLQDIALYFFPVDDIERSGQNQEWLFEHMEIQNLMMRSCVEDVELLIFTSKQLNVDSQNVMMMLKTERFLFGVFRSVQTVHDKFPIPTASKELPFPTPQCVSDDRVNSDDSRTVDMEIDMLGGKNVGTLDVIARKEPSTQTSTGPGNGSEIQS
ncbi:PHD finger-containing protein 6 isoform X1 [Ziziphus jujuba]|uniref:PHD finger-containing protein 6 isoform X1 n=1 Tax=Ziziphus jujuba TaxID=326968 RepID=A0ABM4A0H6_ZIZJJ|nr:PHD finger-containing protein 6 isoform X1 [Ziziphus jujuba]XP_060670236.1 PHD finger-containing protein 6 isoform X1 [Ziziphus jujuba]